MRSPKDMRIIEIELTNACVHKCSNCTRMCGHHKENFFMDFETFKRAVDSMEGFENLVSLMGGEPTLHPEYERFAEYINSKYGMKIQTLSSRQPIVDFMPHMKKTELLKGLLNKFSGPATFTCMPVQYYKKYETIQDTILFQGLNDHMNPSFHQPLLISRKDLNIPDDKWFKLRDNCWIQNYWSASITPKGAFFCEIAGALDMLFDGPGGWPIEKGWWNREPKDFGDQLHWCEICGAALNTFMRNANDEIDDVSQTLLEKLKVVNSPRVKKDKVNIYHTNDAYGKKIGEVGADKYIEDFNKRFSEVNHTLYPKHLEGILICEDIIEASYIQTSLKQFDSIILMTNNEMLKNKMLNTIADMKNVDIVYVDTKDFGRILNVAIQKLIYKDWVLVFTPNVVLSEDFSNRIKSVIINPGVLYKYTFDNRENELAALKGGKAVMSLFNPLAKSLKKVGYDGIFKCGTYDEFEELWAEDKRYILKNNFDCSDAYDYKEYEHAIDSEYLKDEQFKQLLRQNIDMEKNKSIVVIQCASHFFTRALVRVLQAIGFDVHVVLHQRFLENFNDVVEGSRLHIFNECSNFEYDKLKAFLDGIKASTKFDGAIIPYSTDREYFYVKDNYIEVEKIAQYLAGNILAKVNFKRRLI